MLFNLMIQDEPTIFCFYWRRSDTSYKLISRPQQRTTLMNAINKIISIEFIQRFKIIYHYFRRNTVKNCILSFYFLRKKHPIFVYFSWWRYKNRLFPIPTSRYEIIQIYG